MNPGKRFENTFRKSVDGFVMRIPDKVYLMGNRVMSDESEADFVVANEHGVFLVECKAVNRPRLDFYNVKEHQERSLVDFDGAGGFTGGLLAVEFYDPEGYRKPRRMFLLSIRDWLAFKDGTERKSMPVSEFERVGRECPQTGSLYAVDFSAFGKERR